MSRSSSLQPAPFELSPTTTDGSLAGLISQPEEEARIPVWVLYLHGFGSSQQGEKAEFFRQRSLAVGLSFVSFDFQGHGLSGGTIRDLTISRCLRDVDRVREYVESSLRFPSWAMVLMGSSMGGLVGLWAAARHGAAAGAFVAPALGLDESFPRLIGAEGIARWQQSGILPITNEMGTFDLGWGFVEDLRSRRPEQLQEVHRLPTIIFQGKLDDRVSWEQVERFADGTAGLTRLVLFADGDHRLLTRKDVIWSETVDFFATLGLLEPDRE